MVSSDCLLMDARLQEWSVQAPMSDLGMHQLSSYGCQITGMECPSPMPRFMVSSDCLLMDARLQGWSAQAPCPSHVYGMHRLSSYGCQIAWMELTNPMPGLWYYQEAL